MTNLSRRGFLETTLGAAAVASLPATRTVRAADPSGRIKIGQIGTAHAHAAGKMSTLRKLADHYEVVGVVEPDENARRQYKDHPAYRGLQWMTEEQLLNTPRLQAVAVETGVAELVPTAARCIDAGTHIHLDKPAGESLPPFKALLDAAERGGLTVQLGYMFRNNPAFQFCFRAVRSGWLGSVFELHAVMSKAIPPSRRDPLAEFPGGAMFELGCHLIDAAVSVLGKPDRVTPFVRRTRPQRDDLADNTLAVLEYPRATATIRSALVEIEGTRRRQFVVCGDQGTIDIRPLEPPQLLMALAAPRDGYSPGYQEVALPHMPGRYDDQLVELAEVIRGERENPYPPSHDLAVQETILRASDMPVD